MPDRNKMEKKETELSLQDVMFLIQLLETSQLNAPYVQWGPIVDKLKAVIESARTKLEDVKEV